MIGPTPQVQKVIDELVARFPWLRTGFFNCRRIGGSTRWSQHAGSEPKYQWYGNAGDLFDPANSYGSPRLDQVCAYLRRHQKRLKIRTILWRVKNHYDHIHFDCWPRMKDSWNYRPPCKGGKLVTIDEDGTIRNTFAVDGEETEVEYAQIGDQGNTVAKIQKALNGYRAKFQPTLPLLDVDGDFGPLTRDAVIAYQKGAEIPRYDPGVVGQLTMSLLMEFVQDWADPPSGNEGITSGSVVHVDGAGFEITGVITETE